MDLDASACLLTGEMNSIDKVWYRKTESNCRSVIHSGDELTGAKEGDDERIYVNVPSIPMDVHYILFTVSVFSAGHSFKEV